MSPDSNFDHPIPDSTGIRIYYTPVLRKYELGNVQIGQSDIEIPANSTRTKISGGCSNYCSNKLFNKPFYLTRTFIHMHSLGNVAFHFAWQTQLAFRLLGLSVSVRSTPVHLWVHKHTYLLVLADWINFYGAFCVISCVMSLLRGSNNISFPPEKTYCVLGVVPPYISRGQLQWNKCECGIHFWQVTLGR